MGEGGYLTRVCWWSGLIAAHQRRCRPPGAELWVARAAARFQQLLLNLPRVGSTCCSSRVRSSQWLKEIIFCSYMNEFPWYIVFGTLYLFEMIDFY